MSLQMRKLAVFIAITLVIAGVIAYLGYRTIEYEALWRQHQTLALARTRVAQAQSWVMEKLMQKTVRLDALAQFIEPESDRLNALEREDEDIRNVFILQKNRLIYPDERQPLTPDEQEWVRIITPLVYDPSLLYGHNERSEQESLHAGWFVVNGERGEPILVYWRRENAIFTGFRISYIKFLSEIVVAANFDFSPDRLTIKENGRILIQSNVPEEQDRQISLAVATLPYPLNGWQIEYFSASAPTWPVYAWGGFFLLLALAGVATLMFGLFREYTRSARMARRQVDFVSQVSHELKTPLTNINLYAELLQEELEDLSEDAARCVDVIHSEGRRLSRLIQNILTFTRTPKINLTEVDIAHLLEQVARVFAPSFAAKGMTLNVDIPENIRVRSDADRLTQILGNFLSNAEKYAADGKRVDLAVCVSSQWVDISVRDYGNGIAEKETQKIFQPFYRVRCSITEGVSGTGIGLTIARQLAESLSGVIRVDHPDPGVRFTLRLMRQGRLDEASLSGKMPEP